jgi:hypothetical protein
MQRKTPGQHRKRRLPAAVSCYSRRRRTCSLARLSVLPHAVPHLWTGIQHRVIPGKSRLTTADRAAKFNLRWHHRPLLDPGDAKMHPSGSKSGSGRWSHWGEIGWVHYPEIAWSHSDEIRCVQSLEILHDRQALSKGTQIQARKHLRLFKQLMETGEGKVTRFCLTRVVEHVRQAQGESRAYCPHSSTSQE